MTLDLDALERLHREATAGEWRTVKGPPAAIYDVGYTTSLSSCDRTVFAETDRVRSNGANGVIVLASCDDEDARLIAALRNAAPELLKVARAVREWGEARAAYDKASQSKRQPEYETAWLRERGAHDSLKSIADSLTASRGER